MDILFSSYSLMCHHFYDRVALFGDILLMMDRLFKGRHASKNLMYKEVKCNEPFYFHLNIA